MSTLQELVLRIGGFSTEELNRAIFEHPESNVLSAVEASFGPQRTSHLRAAVAAELGIELLADVDLTSADEALYHIPPLELLKLLDKGQGIPLSIRPGAEPLLSLAVLDPLHRSAIQAFEHAYARPVAPILVTEPAFRDAVARIMTLLKLLVQKERQDLVDPATQTARLLEDPEVKKALQQIVASAVKHQASSIRLSLGGCSTAAHFSFGDGLESQVELRVSPVSVLGSIIRRGQLLSETAHGFLGASRVRFKSVTVNFEFRVENMVAQSLDEATLKLDRFVLDNPDNPAFWFGIGERGRQGIRQMLESPQGLFLMTSARASTRDFVLRSVADSFPDVIIVKASRVGEIDPELLERAREQRVVVGLDAADLFPLLAEVRDGAPAVAECLGGIVAFHQLPRNCPVCSKSLAPDDRFQSVFTVPLFTPDANVREGSGCTLCGERGAIGFWGASSYVDMRGSGGESLRSVSSWHRVLATLRDDGFVSLYEDALESAAHGIVPYRIALGDCPQPPEDYKALLSERAPVQEDTPSPAFPTAGSDHRTTASGSWRLRQSRPELSEPVRGPDAFLMRPRTAEEPRNDGLLEDDHAFGSLALGDARDDSASKRAQARDKALLLVIDDDPDQRAILRRVFELAGYSVEVAADGIDGIVSAVRLVPEVIIVDFMMPELDGRETIRRLKQGATTKEIPIVALTAYADPEVELGLLQAGADDFCPKSVSKQVLLKRIERLVAK